MCTRLHVKGAAEIILELCTQQARTHTFTSAYRMSAATVLLLLLQDTACLTASGGGAPRDGADGSVDSSTRSLHLQVGPDSSVQLLDEADKADLLAAARSSGLR